MIRIKIKKEFSFIPEDQEYLGILTLYLPADENGHLIKELRNGQQTTFYAYYEHLTPLWGTLAENGWRCASKKIYRKSIGEVINEIEKIVEETVSTLRQVYRNNQEKISQLPGIAEEVYIID